MSLGGTSNNLNRNVYNSLDKPVFLAEAQTKELSCSERYDELFDIKSLNEASPEYKRLSRMAWFGISLLKREVYAPLKQLQNQSTLLYSRKSDFNFFAQRKDVQKSYQDAINKNYDEQQKEKKALIEKLLKLRDECFDKTAPEYGVIKEDLENLGYHKIKAHNSKSAPAKLKNRPKLAPAFTTGMSKPKKPESWHFPTLSFPDVGNILIGAEKLLEAFGALNQSNP